MILLAAVLWLLFAGWLLAIVRSGAIAERRWVDTRSLHLKRWRDERRIGLN